MDETLWHRLAVALGIGLIVGLERGWKLREQRSGTRTAGLRTFAIAALGGGVLAAASQPDRFVVLGARLGLTLTALFGGLSSSTAVTLAYARRSRTDRTHARVLGTGIALAAATMVPRLAVELAAVNRALLAPLAPTLAALMLVPLAAVLVLALRGRDGTPAGNLKLSNPLELRAALGFGALLIVLFIAVEGLRRAVGDAGIYSIAAVAALLDVDAVTLAVAKDAAEGTLDATTAQRAIALAALVNTAVKGVLAAALGGLPMLRSASLVLGLALAAGTAAALVTL